MSPFWILLELRMMEVVVTAGAINRRAKLQSKHYHQQTSTQLFTGQMPFLSPSQQCQSTEGNIRCLVNVQEHGGGTERVVDPRRLPYDGGVHDEAAGDG